MVGTASVVFATVIASIIGFIGFFGVKRTVINLLALFKKARLFYLRLKGSTPTKEIEKRVVSGQAWEEFCDTLKAAGATLCAPGAPMDPFDQAEGYRYLTRLVRGGLANFMECSDYHRPRLVAIANGATETPVKLGSDNPDNLYQNAMISGKMAYIVTAKRNTVNYLGFGSQSGTYGKAGGLKTVDYKESGDFRERDGLIELLVAPINFMNHENFLKTAADPEDASIIVRQTFADKSKEIPAKVKIRRVDGVKFDIVNGEVTQTGDETSLVGDADSNNFNEDDRLTCEQVDNALGKTGLFVAGASMMFARWADEFSKHANTLPLFDVERSNAVGGDPFIRYYHSYWKLADDECLIIKAMPPKKLFTWNFQVNNHWLESLDYRYYRVHVNMATASYRSDGSICIILSLRDPYSAVNDYKGKKPVTQDVKTFDWLSTTGHNRGAMCFRWIRPEPLHNLPQPTTVVCKLKDCVDFL